MVFAKFSVLFQIFREPPHEEKKKTVMDEGELEATIEEKPTKTEAEILQWLQSLFLFSLCWSIGGNLDTDSRLRFSDFLKVLEAGTNKQHQRFVLVSMLATHFDFYFFQADNIQRIFAVDSYGTAT